MTIENEHRGMVAKLCKPGQDIIETLTPTKMHCLHMAVGIAGEAGEILDCIAIPVDVENLVEELGDIEFYMEGLRNGYDICRDDIVATLHVNDMNITKVFPYAKNRAKDIGIAACDLLDQVKKDVIYNKEPDIGNIIQHLCELEYHMYGLRKYYSILRDQTLSHNLEKLGVRYKNHEYSDKQAHDRADKATA